MGDRGWPLELDGYCSELELTFEYQGQQHYDPDTYLNTLRPGAFEGLVERDRLNKTLCEAAGVQLVVVPYVVKDKGNFVRLALQQLFPISAIFPLMISE